MKVVLCNMGYSGYWVACWRELVKYVDFMVFTPETRYPYPSETIAGLPVVVLDKQQMANRERVAELVEAEHPDVLLISGWASPAFKALAYDRRFSRVKKVMIVDSSWNGSLRQILSRFLLRDYVKRLDGIIVGGERGRKFARWIGFKPNRIFRSIYGYDADAFASCLPHRLKKSEWPRRFCFVGRYVPVKGIDCLLKAYAAYRRQVENPWPLDCYGSGPMQDALGEVEGVVVKGFVNPQSLPNALAEEGAFVFPSLCEPWGVALAEAAGAGLPIICSDMVTSGDDLVKDSENGFVVKAGSVKQLTAAFVKLHHSKERLREMGALSAELAKDFAPKAWSRRWMEAFHVLVG